MRKLSVNQWLLISCHVYLLLSLNFAGIFANGLPGKRRVGQSEGAWHQVSASVFDQAFIALL